MKCLNLLTLLGCLFFLTKSVLAQGTILPTDTLPLNYTQNGAISNFENAKIRLLNKLPSKFYFNSVIESSFRLETNPWQYPPKSSLQFSNPSGAAFNALPKTQQAQILKTINLSNSVDDPFRIYPNLTAGWAFTPNTRIFGNYFMINDTMMRHVNQPLNSVVQSVGGGIQQNIPINLRNNITAQFMVRQLYQTSGPMVFDYLPGLTYTHMFSPNFTTYASSVLQLRGRQFMVAPTAEIDPYYTFGGVYRRGSFIFLANSTLVTNFRNHFSRQIYPFNSYLWVLDFEIDKQLFKQIPGLYSFLRAEPVFNFHSGGNYGFSGFDFRLFYGLRYVFGKPAVNNSINLIRQQIKEQEMLEKKNNSNLNNNNSRIKMQSQNINPSPNNNFGSGNSNNNI